MTELRIYAKVSFRSSHQLTAPHSKKQQLGAICDIQHGHEYFLTACYKKHPDPTTGLCLSRGKIKHLLQEHIKLPLHNKYLNQKLQLTSGEAIARWCYEALRSAPEGESLEEVTLDETKKNSFRYSGGDTANKPSK